MKKPVSNEALTQIFRSMKDEFVTETQIRNVIIENKQGVTFLERNTPYENGDLIHHKNLKKGLLLKCIQSGVTGNEEPDV